MELTEKLFRIRTGSLRYGKVVDGSPFEEGAESSDIVLVLAQWEGKRGRRRIGGP